MPVVDISSKVLTRGKSEVTQIILWLAEHVGEYLGRGEDPVVDIGSGWEIRTVRDMIPDEGTATSWVLDITDEKKFMLYVLRWGA